MKGLTGLHTRVLELDFRACHRAVELRQVPLVSRAALLVSRSGDGYLTASVGVGALVFAGHEGEALFFSLVIAFCIERPAYLILKHVFRRDRPMTVIGGASALVTPGDKFSLPSGHTSAACCTAVIVSLASPGLAPLMVGWALAVAASRVVVGVHFPSDTVAGCLLGVGCAMASVHLVS